MGLTVGQHNDMLWRQDAAMQQINHGLPWIADSLRGNVIFNVSKELYDLGKISKEEYIDDLIKVAKLVGVTYKLEGD